MSTGREIAERILDRLGIEEDERQAHPVPDREPSDHDVLSQRRELSDQKVITEFGATVQDVEKPKHAVFLTYADLSARKARMAWTPWKLRCCRSLSSGPSEI